MKVLYVAFRNDPQDPDAGSSADYQFYSALQRNGADVKLLGPFPHQALLLERIWRKGYKWYTGKRPEKYAFSLVWRISQALNHTDKLWKPDVIFTLFPVPLVFYSGVTPCIYRIDTTFRGWQTEGGSPFGKLSLKMGIWQENQAFKRCVRIITHSQWCQADLIKNYCIDPEKVRVFPNPAALPRHIIPLQIDIRQIKELDGPLRLLLVGRAYERKGIDIAIDIVNRLHASGVQAELTIVGLEGTDTELVKFSGSYKKSHPDELEKYISFYKRAHLLLHPARFDPSPIVTSEAAAFGVPSITNAVGGITTSVQDGKSGIVLPKRSSVEVYVEAIKQLVSDSEQYYRLCASTHQRFQQVLNWEAGRQSLASVFDEVVSLA